MVDVGWCYLVSLVVKTPLKQLTNRSYHVHLSTVSLHDHFCIRIWGCIKTRYLFKWPTITLREFFTPLIVFSGGELPVDKKCEFSSFLWVWKHPRSRVNGCHRLFSFPFIAFHFAFISYHAPFMLHSFPFILHSFPFILLSCPFMFRRYVSKIQVFESWYAQTGQVGIRPNARVFFFIILLSFLLSFSYRFGGLCRLPSSGFTNMYMYKLVIVLFTLIVFWAGNALAVLRCRPS